jgi:hypothetical protein
MLLGMGLAGLFYAAKKNGIQSWSDVKKFIKPGIKKLKSML